MSKTRILITATVFAFAPFIFSQDVPDGASPVLPADIVGPQLIMWSELQKPQPVPQPLPPPEKADQQQSEQPSQQQPGQPEPATGSQAQGQPTAQIFTGTIVKDGDKYILKASGGTAYQVDDQEKAKHYEGKQVKVTGSLDKSNVLHISGIELLS
jgi:hypothetical protein